MKPAIRNLLFDLDGTILDTNELIIRSFMHALQGVVPEGFGREQMIPHMGLTLIDQLKQFSGLDDPSHLIPLYREKNMQLHDDLVKPFPYTQEVLEQLKAAGYQAWRRDNQDSDVHGQGLAADGTVRLYGGHRHGG